MSVYGEEDWGGSEVWGGGGLWLGGGIPTPENPLVPPPIPFSLADFTQRIISLLPQAWFSDAALRPGGNTYSLLNALAVPFQMVKQQIDYVNLQKRLLTATDTNLEAIADDFFGPGNFLRGSSVVGTTLVPEPDASYALRIQQNVVAPKNTLAAIQTRVQSYINEFYVASQVLNSELLGADTSGSLDGWGALDGRPSNVPPLPTITVFDIQSNPTLSAQVGLTAGQFCILATYGGLRTQGFFLGQAFLGNETTTGDDTFLVSDNINVLSGALNPALAALVESIKGTGFQPVWADNRS